jgi:hypothetical protein
VPTDTANKPKFSYFVPLQQLNSGLVTRLNVDGLNYFFLITHCQPTDRRSVVGDHRRKVMKGRGQNERNQKEACHLNKSVKLRIL